MPDFDTIFDTIHGLRAKRDVVFLQATSYSLVSETVTYAPSSTISAKVLWRDDSTRFQRGVWQETDVAALTIWFKDLMGNRTGTSTDIQDWTTKFKGQVNEGDRERWSRFIIDGQRMKARAIIAQERPDGKVHALKVFLEAAE